MKQEFIDAFPLLSSGIREVGLTTLTLNSCLVIKADNVMTLLEKIQRQDNLEKLGNKSKNEIKKIISPTGLILPKSFGLSSYQKIILKAKICAN